MSLRIASAAGFLQWDSQLASSVPSETQAMEREHIANNDDKAYWGRIDGEEEGQEQSGALIASLLLNSVFPLQLWS
ncbi:MAG TPA: hypothetical protein VGA05_04380 [Candidatus Bathyarchaeia archaeon]